MSELIDTGPPKDRALFPRWLVAIAAIATVGYAIFALRGVLTPVFFAFLIAYMLDPVVDALERRKIPRAAAIALLLLPAIGGVVAFILFAVPALVREVMEFAQDLPAKLEGLLSRLEPRLETWGVQVPHSVGELLEQLKGTVPTSALQPATGVLGWIVGRTASVFSAVIAVATVPIFAFYLLYDFDRMRHAVRSMIPWRVRPRVLQIAQEIDSVLGQFVRGQLLVMLILAALYSIAYSILGVRLALAIGIAGGLLSFIPYVGGAVSVGSAVFITLLDGKGWQDILLVVGAYAIVQLLDGTVVTPRVMGGKVGLSAVWVLFALMVGAQTFGFLGVLLAVPAAAVAKILIGHAMAAYRKSRVFQEGAPPSPPPPVEAPPVPPAPPVGT